MRELFKDLSDKELKEQMDLYTQRGRFLKADYLLAELHYRYLERLENEKSHNKLV